MEYDDLKEKIGEKYATALMMHQAERTYVDIGDALGVSRSRARQIVIKAKRLLHFPEQSEFTGLNSRITNVLKNAGYETKKQVLQDFESGALSPDNRQLQNYGLGSHRIVCQWLGVEYSDPVVSTALQRSNDKTIARYIEYLEKNGYKVEKIN